MGTFGIIVLLGAYVTGGILTMSEGWWVNPTKLDFGDFAGIAVTFAFWPAVWWRNR